MHGPTPWGDWQGRRQSFQLGKEKLGPVFTKQTSKQALGSRLSAKASVLITLTVTKNQGARRESSRENRVNIMQRDLTEYIELATATKPPLGIFFTEAEFSQQFYSDWHACPPPFILLKPVKSANIRVFAGSCFSPLTGRGSFFLHWFCKIASSLKHRMHKWPETNLIKLLTTE